MGKKPNIVLIVVDTLRQDRLHCYGYKHQTSPNIDRLASEGALAESFFCPGIPTYPSFTTLYTGQHPVRHGIVAHGNKAQLDREAPFLPQILLEAGYTTCAIDNLNRARPWFARGYEFYIDPSIRRPLLLGVTCEELNRRIVPWLENHGDEQFFLFVHYWDPHWPLLPPARYRNLFYEGKNFRDPADTRLEAWWKTPLGALARDTWLQTRDGLITDPEYVSAMYDQEIRHLDDGIGEVMATIDRLGIADETVFIVTADHGESLTEHGIYFDHHGLYDCTVRVPFIARWPEKIPRGLRIPALLQNLDTAPTLLAAADEETPAAMDGRSFLPLLQGEKTGGGYEFVVCAECTRQAKWSMRTKEHKIIVSREQDFYGNPLVEMYDLLNDPGEVNNIAPEQPELARKMQDKLESWIAERLQSLGKTEDPLKAQGVSLGVMPGEFF
ncbi:MAG: sulfatase [Pseudomonadota bacterium]